jgi:thiol-disulfide isomerase/thioredoxin
MLKIQLKQGLLFASILFLFGTCTSQSIPKWKITELEEYIKKSEQPVIVNFWATYCVPCIKEIPYFHEMVNKYERTGIKLLLVSLDFEESYPGKITSFATQRKFTAPIVWLDETNADYFCPRIDSSWSGVMPASLFVNNKTGYRRFFESEMTKEELESEILKMTSAQ